MSKLVNTTAKVVKGVARLKPSQNAITLTPEAIQQVKHLLQQQNAKALKIDIRQKEANGPTYSLDCAQEKAKSDEEVIQDGVRIWIDKRAQQDLNGKEMDFINSKQSEFIFRNHEVKGQMVRPFIYKDRRIQELLRSLREFEQNEEEEEKRRIVLVPNKLEEKKLTLKDKVVKEIKHYYNGSRLLWLEIRLSAKYSWRFLNGYALSRKERQQLQRTIADLFRLIPFSIFLIVPFMEFLLPVFIKIFPNMLPSTFQDSSKEAERIKQQARQKIEMAKFLQDTIEEIALERKSKLKADDSQSQALDFAYFMKKVRTEGGYVSNMDILKFSKLFEDELTLDNLSMSQLRSLCRVMSIQPFGSPEILRFQLNMKLRELKIDDQQIAIEGGVDTMNTLDLQQACRERGMRAIGVSEERLREQLKQWVELSLNEKVPPSFLLLSRCLYLPEDISFTDRLKAIMQHLPEGVAEMTRQKLTEEEGGKVDHHARIELIKNIEAVIMKERQIEEENKKVEEQKKDVERNDKKDSEKEVEKKEN